MWCTCVGLRRVSVGSFINQKMYNLDELEQLANKGFSYLDEVLLATDQALLDWPAVTIADHQMKDMRNGHALALANLPVEGVVRIYDSNQEFYGIGKVREDGRMTPKPLI